MPTMYSLFGESMPSSSFLLAMRIFSERLVPLYRPTHTLALDTSKRSILTKFSCLMSQWTTRWRCMWLTAQAIWYSIMQIWGAAGGKMFNYLVQHNAHLGCGGREIVTFFAAYQHGTDL